MVRQIFFVYLLLYTFKIYAGPDDDQKIVDWSIQSTKSDFERNSDRRDLPSSKTRFESGRSDWGPSLILNLSMSHVPRDHLQGLKYVHELYSNQQFMVDTGYQYSKDDSNDPFSLIKRMLGHVGSNLQAKGDPEFDAMTKKWRRYSAFDVLAAKTCAGLMCEPGAPRENVGAVREMFSLMSPFPLARNNTMISYLDLWNKVIQNPVYAEASIRIAKNLIAIAEEAKATGNVRSNLYDEVVRGFTDSGVGMNLAKEMALDLLGVYGTRGVDINNLLFAGWPSSSILHFSRSTGGVMPIADIVGVQATAILPTFIFPRNSLGSVSGAAALPVIMGEAVASVAYESMEKVPFVSKRNFPLITALSVLSVATTYLDSMSIRKGSLFSLPKNVVNHASYTRPYHFWLSAALTRDLAASGYSPEAILEAIYRVGLVYELKASVGTVEAELLGVHEGYTGETKKDLVFNGAGAVWQLLDSSQGQEKKVDLDKIWTRMMDLKGSSSPLSAREVFNFPPSIFGALFGKFLGEEKISDQLTVLDAVFPLAELSGQMEGVKLPKLVNKECYSAEREMRINQYRMF